MTATYPETSNTTTLIKPAIKWGALVFFIVTFCIVLALPQSTVIPVEGATTNDWNHKTFWYEPWGSSGTHKGIDIFGAKGTPLVAATGGVVIFSGELSKGGTVVAVLGPKWRVHYYAHMDSAKTFFGDWVSQGEVIGALGDSGNAAGKAPHLHYSILTLVPYPWRWDASTQGWKKCSISTLERRSKNSQLDHIFCYPPYFSGCLHIKSCLISLFGYTVRLSTRR